MAERVRKFRPSGRAPVDVYGSQGQLLQQRAATYDLLVALRSAGVEIDPRAVLGSQDARLQQRATTNDLLVEQTVYDQTGTVAIASPAGAGDTAVIAAPAANNSLQVKLLQVWNRAGSAVTVYWHYGADATRAFGAKLSDATGYIVNLIGANWKDATGARALNLNLSGNLQVDCTVLYKTVAT